MEDLLREIRAFIAERDWDQFHSPKNIAMAMVVEAAEIVEHFQWLTQAESRNLDAGKLAEVKDEIGDVLVYLLDLSDKLGINAIEAAHAKIVKNREKYPAEQVRGKSDKYTEY